ncbi:hypothetical protein TSUD_338020 [Trifolium subterraneum]|uniref:Uncharacterized protein n=1 Tax=Trifolium subterraneum TaxID=3900 RepID=A0A2Z6MCK6_TRISU|nr:hypothetical protein TSUD_338020 [Trifolium subterraneum]
MGGCGTGLFERDETKHAPGQGYFRRILATLGTCSDLLNSIVITFQTNSVPREATLQRTLEEVSNYLLEGDVISLRSLKKSITDLFNKVNDAIKDIKELLVIEDTIASLEAEFHGDEADD